MVKRETTTRKRTTRRTTSKKVRATGSCARDRVLKGRRTTKRITRRLKAGKRAAPAKKKVGVVTHFFDKISVAVIKLSGTLKEGDKISIEGATTNFQQPAKSMQIEHKQVKQARKGQSIGLKVKDKVREKDIVYRI